MKVCFLSLYLQCETGSIATGDLNFTSAEPAPQPTEHVSTIDIDAHDSHLNPFLANVDDHMPSSGPIDIDEIETPSSSCSKILKIGLGRKESSVLLEFYKTMWTLGQMKQKYL